VNQNLFNLFRANPIVVTAFVIMAINFESLIVRLKKMTSDGVVEFEEIFTEGMAVRYEPIPGDYLVVQSDGYRYFNPRDVFERKYSPIPRETTVMANQIADLLSSCKSFDSKLGEKTTMVRAVLPCGFEIIETSSCVDPANYDHEMGKKICFERIVDKLWYLEGYRLQNRLHEANG
jgi:hypothetical protein